MRASTLQEKLRTGDVPDEMDDKPYPKDHFPMKRLALQWNQEKETNHRKGVTWEDVALMTYMLYDMLYTMAGRGCIWNNNDAEPLRPVWSS